MKQIASIIKAALKEDIGSGDITSRLVISAGKKIKAVIIAKESGVVCGLDVAKLIFNTVDRKIRFWAATRDGKKVKKGKIIARLEGRAHSILKAERVALNFLARLSGIATLTNKFVQKVKPYRVKIMDTRKTTPGLRSLEKYAVRCAGGVNHRMGLWDQVLLKDNHVKAHSSYPYGHKQLTAHSLKKLIEKVRVKIPKRMKIEIEVKNLSQFKQVLAANPDVIMLDNMPVKNIKQAVKLRNQGKGNRPELEVSGGVKLDNVRRINRFKLVSDFESCGDQPQAIEKLSEGLESNKRYQTLLGATGTGKTFTVAQVIARTNLPTLVISHNKTLAAQLYSEFKQFFPHNAVEYFVSYYDYYQPEAYIPQTDTYIEKDASINDELDRLRLSATSSLMTRRDVLIVASVSCIYNLGSPEDYEEKLLHLEKGERLSRQELLRRLVDIQYERNDIDFRRGRFRVRGDVIDIFPAYRQKAFRLEFSEALVEKISEIDPLTGKKEEALERIALYPAKHFVTTETRIRRALHTIKQELKVRLDELRQQNKLLEAQRLESRTHYDMEMLEEFGFCNGIENYSRHLSARPAGSRPYCLIDYFPDKFLTVIDESHVGLPQLRGMYNGDRARKKTLVNYGFRLPSALDNRPLRFGEFEKLVKQLIFVSATPGECELSKSGPAVEQIIRPTGLLDPEIIVKPTENQIDDLIDLVRERAQRKERVLVTTLTKRMAEDLASYLGEMNLRVKYLHSEIGAIDRVAILRDLRLRKFDCLVGINLLREGLDLPEVSLVAVLDADKEGFLRSATSLIQVAGRAARNINGQVILYADNMTGSMKKAIRETERRRQIQSEYNQKNNITPRSIQKAIRESIEAHQEAEEFALQRTGQKQKDYDLEVAIAQLQGQMQLYARNLEFEKAALVRDEIAKLKK
jgi:excinuclease ABC subunit B